MIDFAFLISIVDHRRLLAVQVNYSYGIIFKKYDKEMRGLPTIHISIALRRVVAFAARARAGVAAAGAAQ